MKKLTLVGTALTGLAAAIGVVSLIADHFTGKKAGEPTEDVCAENVEVEPEAPEEEEAPAEE